MNCLPLMKVTVVVRVPTAWETWLTPRATREPTAAPTLQQPLEQVAVSNRAPAPRAGWRASPTGQTF